MTAAAAKVTARRPSSGIFARQPASPPAPVVFARPLMTMTAMSPPSQWLTSPPSARSARTERARAAPDTRSADQAPVRVRIGGAFGAQQEHAGAGPPAEGGPYVFRARAAGDAEHSGQRA